MSQLFTPGKGIQQGLARTRQSFFGRVAGLFGASDITPQLYSELEELLIQADVGVETTVALVEGLQEEVNRRHLRRAADAGTLLRQQMIALLNTRSHVYLAEKPPLAVILVVGVNGSGKTTSIAKLAHYHQARGESVILAAADTFRAAAIDQLRVWGDRLGADVIAHQPGADPGAVVYDAVRAALARKADVLIVDTAGRLHTKYNLMQELKKVHSIATRELPGAPHETLLVLDATTGQNGLAQATHFSQAVNVTGIFLAKLDGTAKGGIAFAIARQLGLPILFVGTGEGLDDMAPFDPTEFVNGLFEKS